MIALLRAQVRALRADGPHTLLSSVSVFSPAFFFLFPFGGVVWHALAFASAGALALVVRGRVVGPGGAGARGTALPALPVTETQRTLVSAGLAGVGLAVASTVVFGGAWELFGDAPATNPFAGMGTPPAALPIVVSSAMFGWLPFLVAGARAEALLEGRRVLLFCGACLLAAALETDHEPLRGALGCALSVPLLSRRFAGDAGAPASSPTMRLFGGGLVGLLLGMSWEVVKLAGFGIVLAAVVAGLLGRWSGALVPLLPLMAWIAMTFLPILPGGARAGSLVSVAPETLFRLPVSRTRVVFLVLLVGAARSLLLTGLSLLPALGSPLAPPAPLLAWGALFVAASGAATAVAGLLRGPGGVVLTGLGAAPVAYAGLHLASQGAPAWQIGAVAGLLASLAALLALVAAAPFRWSPRPLG